MEGSGSQVGIHHLHFDVHPQLVRMRSAHGRLRPHAPAARCKRQLLVIQRHVQVLRDERPSALSEHGRGIAGARVHQAATALVDDRAVRVLGVKEDMQQPACPARTHRKKGCAYPAAVDVEP